MITILMLVALALMLGFTLSLVCNAVIDGEEHSIGTSIGIVVAWIVAVWALEYGLRSLDIEAIGGPWLKVLASTIGSFLILAVLLKLIINATIKQAALIAVIYSIVLAVVSFGLRACVAAGT